MRGGLCGLLGVASALARGGTSRGSMIIGVVITSPFLASFQLSGPSLGQAWVAENPNEGA